MKRLVIDAIRLNQSKNSVKINPDETGINTNVKYAIKYGLNPKKANMPVISTTNRKKDGLSEIVTKKPIKVKRLGTRIQGNTPKKTHKE